MTTITTQPPELSEYDQERLEVFLVETLGQERFISITRYPLPQNRLCLYVDNGARMLSHGYWASGSGYITLAGEEGSFPVADRLPILLALTQFCKPTERLTKAAGEGIARYLLGQFNTFKQSLVVSPVPSDGIAFSTDNRVASRVGGEWMTASGESVDVSGPEWTVCATTLTDTGVVAPTEPRVFHIGDRVRYAEIPHVPGLGSGIGTITGELYTNHGRDAYHIDAEDGSNYYVFASDLTPADAPVSRPFAVGDRVRFNSIPAVTDQPGWGTVVSVDGIGNMTVSVTEGDGAGGHWSVGINANGVVHDYAAGDRVHFTDPEGDASGDGTIRFFDEISRMFDVTLDSGTIVPARHSELALLV